MCHFLPAHVLASEKAAADICSVTGRLNVTEVRKCILKGYLWENWYTSVYRSRFSVNERRRDTGYEVQKGLH
jgi:hypothetical protein